MSALRGLFSEVRSHIQSLFFFSGFDGLLEYEIIPSKSTKTKVNILDVMSNGMCLFGVAKKNARRSLSMVAKYAKQGP